MWITHCDVKSTFSPDKFYTQIRNLGELDALDIFINANEDAGVTGRVLEALQLPPPSLRLDVTTFQDDDTDMQALRRLLATYIRKYKQLEEFDFSNWNRRPHAGSEAQTNLQKDLGELAHDRITRHPSVSLSTIVQGSCRHRPAVLYYILQQHVAQLDL